MIEEGLRESRGRVYRPAGDAAKLSISRSTVESKIKSLKIDKNRFRTPSLRYQQPRSSNLRPQAAYA
jgi:hypothetical protein